MPVIREPENADISQLQKLLLKAVPEDKNGYKTVVHLAELLGVSRWAVQKWIVKNKISPDRASQIVDLSDGRVSLADFSRYYYSL